MEVWILSQDLESLAIVDAFDSFIWTDRYAEYGDFELYIPTNTEMLKTCAKDNYVWLSGSEHLMIINEQEIDSESVDGSSMIIRGYSLESLLARRIIWSETSYNGNFQDSIRKMLNDAIINPSDPSRKIDNFVFDRNTDPAITDLKLDQKYLGDNIYTVIKDLCADNGIGFKITPNFDDKTFHFKLYNGVDRTFAQTIRPFVLFSPQYENLVSSNYKNYNKDSANTALVYGMEREKKVPDVYRTVKTTTGDSNTDANKVTRRTETVTTTEYAKDGSVVSKTVEETTSRKTESGLNDAETKTTTVYNSYGEMVSQTVNHNENTGTKHETKNADNEVTRTTGSETKVETNSETDENGTENKKTTTKTVYDKDGNGDINSETVTTTVDEWNSTKKTKKLKSRVYRLSQTVGGSSGGVHRRELFVDAQDVSEQDEEGVDLTDSQINSRLESKGTTEVRKNKEQTTYEGKTDPNVMYKYKEDYDLGDIVQIQNEYGLEGTSRISEIVFSQSTDATTVLPTFSAV